MNARDRFAEMYKKYYEAVRAYFRKKIRNTENLDDLVQDIFAIALEKMILTEAYENQYEWLIKIGENKLGNLLQKKSIHNTSLDMLVENEKSRSSLDTKDSVLVDDTQNVEKEIEKKELWEAVKKLSKRDQHIMKLYSEGLSTDMIGTSLNISGSYVRRRIKVCSNILKGELGNE